MKFNKKRRHKKMIKAKNIKRMIYKNFVYFNIFCISSFVFFIGGFNLKTNFTQADDLCSSPIDVMLAIDVSESMSNGESPSQCEWWSLEWIGGSNGHFEWAIHTDYDITEDWCTDKDQSPHHPSSYHKALKNKLEEAKDSANLFLDNFGANDQSGLVSFNDVAVLVKDLDNNHLGTQSAINGLHYSGATNIGDAILMSKNQLDINSNSQAVKAIILLTDGRPTRPNGDGHTENQADIDYAMAQAEIAANEGYKIFTIGLGESGNLNEILLQDIADISDAQYYYAPNGADLQIIYNDISLAVCQFGSISGCKYVDQSQKTIPDWEIVLDWGEASSTQFTDSEGCYNFAGLSPGSYEISEINKNGWTQVYPLAGSYEATINWGDNLSGYDFRNYENESEYCGDGIVNNNEDCDDGANGDDSDTCTDQCEFTYCGDNITQYPNGYGQYENCDGNAIRLCSVNNVKGIQSCSSCSWGECVVGDYCGDGSINGQEECDDGNNEDGDGCSSECKNENVASVSDIIINEILQNPNVVSDSYGEWFELYNASSTDMNLEGCVISDNYGDSHIIDSSLVIASSSYVVLARDSDFSLNGGITPDYTYDNFILSNSSDAIMLTCGGVEIDRVEYDNGVTFPDSSGISMILSNPSLDNNIGSNWCESSSSFGDGDLGTPGYKNDSCGGVGSVKICKIYDSDGSIETSYDQEIVSGWDFTLEDYGLFTTEEDGCVLIDEVKTGIHSLNEYLPDAWEAVYPVNGSTTIEVVENEQYDINFYNTKKRSIAGCKYDDINRNGIIDDNDSKLSGWEIILLTNGSYSPLNDSELIYISSSTLVSLDSGLPGAWSTLATTTTDNDGCYSFQGLDPGDYGVSEVSNYHWQQEYPYNEMFYYFNLQSGESTSTINFLNIKEYYCGDGTCNNEETCSSCEIDCGSCGGGGSGGGGGGSPLVFRISNPQIEMSCVDDTVSVNFTWLTNKLATSRVIYDVIPHENAKDLESPNYGYAFSTNEDTVQKTGHSVVLNNLQSNASYYFRPVSKASSEIIGEEKYIVKTMNCESGGSSDEIIVLGEEGEPILNISKEVSVPRANPGDSDITYTLKIKNSGNISAYDIEVVDTLPNNGLSYSSGDGATRTWSIEEIAPGEETTLSYMVNVLNDTKEGKYTNTVKLTASNHDEIITSADLEVEEIKVLAETGMNYFELFEIIFVIFTLKYIARHLSYFIV